MSLSQMGRRDLSLVDLLDRILEKGGVINGDITVSVGSVELLFESLDLMDGRRAPASPGVPRAVDALGA